MEHVKNLFVEFKSIFTGEDVLKENEEHANIVTATAMLNLFLICLLTWLLTYFKVFKLGTEIMNSMTIRATILLLIPAIICFILRGRKKWIKYVLFICFTILLAMADAILKYNVTLIMVIPIILAARYYSKNLTIGISIITTITFILSTYMSVKLGQQDINSYNMIIPKGTTITIDSTLRDAVTKIDVNESERIKNIYIHFFIPKLFIYSMIVFACTQISQSGKKMIERQQEISKKGARIETELSLANAIQSNMLPSIFPPFPEHEEIDIYAKMKPAKEVGGDFYDMFLIDENHLAICIADVSGKGIPASLFMMISKILIKNISNIEKEVDNLFNRVNNMLCDGNEIGLFVTAWFGVLDLRNGQIEFVNAGHNPPLVYSKRIGQFEYLKTKPNMVLAGMENIKYEKHKIAIEPGDKIFLYTDGVIEATNAQNKLYGEQRLKNFLNNNISLNTKDTINKLKNDIDEFVGISEQFDDITMLELYYKKKKRDEEKMVQKEFKADISELPKVQEFVEAKLENNNFNMKTINQINLCVEEIFVNISNYAYKEKKGNCNLTINVKEKNNCEIIFEDTGVPFNPLEKENTDIKASLENRQIGGLGIFLVKKTMDSIEYKYENNKNILTLRKNI